MPTAARPDSAQVASWFHALADETRVQIVEMLSHKERCVCKLEQVLGVAQSRLSFHLKVLKNAGLLADRRDGDRKSTRLNSSHSQISYAVFCLKKKKKKQAKSRQIK